jgi:hypothetical protein
LAAGQPHLAALHAWHSSSSSSYWNCFWRLLLLLSSQPLQQLLGLELHCCCCISRGTAALHGAACL